MRGALVVLLFATFPVVADLTQSALTGEVTIGDTPAAGVTVTATARATQTSRTATTNARGRYWIGALTPGLYDITFSRAGLTSLSRPATIELGRITRSDARLEISADEETVMSTVTTVSVAETTPITTHFWGDELDRVPLRRDVITAAELSPLHFDGQTTLDDTALFFPSLLGEEALEEVTIVRGAQPVELGGFGSSTILARTRSGSDAFSLSLRDTYATHGGGGNVLESASAGRIVPERLWFFAAGWGGDATDVRVRKLRGFTLKATAQATPSHHVVASHFDADAAVIPSVSRGTRGPGGTMHTNGAAPHAQVPRLTLGMTATALRYTGIFNERFTAEAIVSRSHASSNGTGRDDDETAAKVSYRTGDHVVSAGGKRDVFHVSDRWSVGRWTVDAGVRHGDTRTTPRIAAAFDLRSDRGSHAIVASWGEYLEFPRQAGPGSARTPVLRVTTLGYTSSLESSGAARIDVFHFEGARDVDQIQADARYRMFDRFEAGGSYVYSRGDDALAAHAGHARIGVQVPFAGHELSAMVLERYDFERWTTDFGARYDVPVRRVALTLAADATNVFDAEDVVSQPRGFRFWVRARL